MNTLRDALINVAAAVGAVVTLGAALWWLVWPRVEDKLEQVARGVRRVEQQTVGDDPGTLSRYARVAAGYSADLPLIKDQITSMVATQTRHDEWQSSTDRRLEKLEAVLLELLATELHGRLTEEDP